MSKIDKLINRIGEENYNKFGTLMKIVEYKDALNIIVEFQDSHKARVHTNYSNFKKGCVSNPYDKTVHGVGYLGIGKYKSRGKDGKKTKAYNTWQHMIRRCYDPYYINKNPTYKDCIVCDEWLCFQNFAEWYYNNCYEIEGEVMHLDKDILCKGNKIYSPETCIFVPHRINVLFTKSDKARGEYPIGVYYRFKRVEQYEYHYLEVACNIMVNGKKKNKTLKTLPLNRPFQAFTIYKEFKENYIKQVADEYKDLIPNKLYEALYKWEVEIND
jgi:hypothetical protein